MVNSSQEFKDFVGADDRGSPKQVNNEINGTPSRRPLHHTKLVVV